MKELFRCLEESNIPEMTVKECWLVFESYEKRKKNDKVAVKFSRARQDLGGYWTWR